MPALLSPAAITQERPKIEVVLRSALHRSPIDSVAVSIDGNRLLSGSTLWGSPNRTEIREWEAATGRLVSTRTFASAGKGVPDAFTPDGIGIFSSRSEVPSLWDAKNGKHIGDFGGGLYSPIAFSLDRVHLVQGVGKTVKLRAVATGKTVHIFDGHAVQVLSVALSRDGTRLASGDVRGTAMIWDATTGRHVRALDPDQGWWAKISGRGRRYSIEALAFSPDGAHILACRHVYSDGGDGLKLWEVATGKLVRSFGNVGKMKLISTCSASFSPDGARVLSVHTGVSGKPATLRLWEPATGRLVHAFDGLPGVASAAFSRDGRLLFSIRSDHAIEIRDAHTGEPVATLVAVYASQHTAGTTGDEWLIVTHEGFMDASTQALAGEMLSIGRGRQVSGIDAAAYEILNRPDLVRAKLAGDRDGKVKEAAAKLGAKLRLD